MNIEKIISDIENADEVEIMEFDFDKCFTALREMKYIIDQLNQHDLRMDKFRSGGYINKDYDKARLSADFNLNDGRKLLGLIKQT